VTSETARALAARGQEVHVLTRTSGEGRVAFEDGIWRHHVAVNDRHLPGLEGWGSADDLYAAVAKYHEVVRLHERAPVDIVVAPLWRAEGLICVLDRRFPTVTRLVTPMKTIARMHPSFALNPQVQGLIRLEKAVLERSRYALAASRAVVAEVESEYGSLDARIALLALGVADRRAPNASPPPGGSDQVQRSGEDPDLRIEVLFVGRLERRKGVDVLLAAARQLLPDCPGLSFTLVGPDTPNTELEATYREAFWRETQGEPALRERVYFAGPVDDQELWDLYQRAAIFCAPSRYESFGNVLIEALMFGKPVVACRAGGMPEVIEDARNGFLAEPGDVPSLVYCLRRLIDDADLREIFGQRSRARYLTHYTLDQAVSGLITISRDIADEHRGSRAADPSLAPAIAELLKAVAQLDGVDAAVAARSLLDGSSYPIDYRGRIDELFDAPSADFLDGVYRIVLGREPDPRGRVAGLRYLDGGGDRLRMVVQLCQSAEARRRGVPTGWLGDLAAQRLSDLPALVRQAWPLPDESFVRTVFEAVLGREPEEEATTSYTRALTSGRDRREVLRLILDSEEARARLVPTDWLSESRGPA
jgi:hypothetical protein